jgi:hypothetical protein
MGYSRSKHGVIRGDFGDLRPLISTLSPELHPCHHQFAFDKFLDLKKSDPGLSFRAYLKKIGGAIEEWANQATIKKHPVACASKCLITSVPARARTVDPLIKSQLLYQLSYRDRRLDWEREIREKGGNGAKKFHSPNLIGHPPNRMQSHAIKKHGSRLNRISTS